MGYDVVGEVLEVEVNGVAGGGSDGLPVAFAAALLLDGGWGDAVVA